MRSRSTRDLRKEKYFNSFDRKLDRFVQTGRQLIDGVSGARPGQRQRNYIANLQGKGVSNVGRWVSDKIDWLFEEEQEEWERTSSRFKTNSVSKNSDLDYSTNDIQRKRPLDAISLRIAKKDFIETQDKELGNHDIDDWDQDNVFKVNKWERNHKNSDSNVSNNPIASRKSSINSRQFPKSNRKRY
tara:strand:- start:15 stop:572 length:558 start_codon:yes stop_codon:yes gene_type:complete